ncbi:hypothetical protein AJ78_01433 [Emergomyces pasteurianus Ep9510]|uniref:AMP-activated protein kinase glycogen-binding domain-containing protein n=1 Tax=Emergomyces pasteurianus Ep9510 TaxID=1447872 RepID=A0A1J9QTB5_9EURO|nr:hypothetical protein AJ78_01433 [Emergomyces pasteurianus Ep9510]
MGLLFALNNRGGFVRRGFPTPDSSSRLPVLPSSLRISHCIKTLAPDKSRSDTTANEVYVTGTFDNWARSVKLDRTADGFRKDVPVPVVGGKMLYKFVVDGAWKIDPTALQEDDGHHNTNNVLLRQHIKQLPPGKDTLDTPAPASTARDKAPETMSGVTPEATTAALAADVSKESNNAPQTETVVPTISSAAPESTTAALAKDVALESKKDSTPGAFPVTPAGETEQYSVKPIPATAGLGNPIQLQPGEPVPDPSTLTSNTITSTVTTDKEGYEKDASAAGFAPPEEKLTTLPATANGTNGLAEPFVQSAGPTSTTAALAGAVPLEKTHRDVNGHNAPETVANDVPEVVKESLAKAHKEPEAAGVATAVEEKKEVEEELLQNVEPAAAAGDAALGVPLVVRKSIDEAHWTPEATAVPEAVLDKKEVEQELLHDVKRVDAAGEPAPVITAETSATAPGTTAPAAGAATLAPDVSRRNQDRSISPKSREPRAPAADTTGPPTTEQTQPTVTTGPETTTAPTVSQVQPQPQTQTQEPARTNSAAIAAAAAAANTTTQPATVQTEAGAATTTAAAVAADQDSKPRKKKNRASAIFSKLKEKFR